MMETNRNKLTERETNTNTRTRQQTLTLITATRGYVKLRNKLLSPPEYFTNCLDVQVYIFPVNCRPLDHKATIRPNTKRTFPSSSSTGTTKNIKTNLSHALINHIKPLIRQTSKEKKI